MNDKPEGLLGAKALLLALWPDEGSRPTLRWLRSMTKRKLIPYLKIGRRVFFEAERVRAALRKRFEIS